LGAEARITIGQAVADLKADFPDVDIRESKIRYLESEGLIVPERTASGYRKYSLKDMEKLRYVIRAQRDAYLPLRVIKEQLDAIDRGLEPPTFSSEPTVPGTLLADPALDRISVRPEDVDVRISRKELLKTTGITEKNLDALIEFGLVKPRTGTRVFDADALMIACVHSRRRPIEKSAWCSRSSSPCVARVKQVPREERKQSLRRSLCCRYACTPFWSEQGWPAVPDRKQGSFFPHLARLNSCVK
jgi:DNA-binding transcriptional MerR regulator